LTVLNGREQIVDVLHGVQTTVRLGTTWVLLDLIFTDRRLVGVTYWDGTARGLVGAAVLTAEMNAERRALQAKAARYDPAGLDALVADRKYAFSFQYANIDKGKISGLFGSRALVVRSGKKEFHLSFPKTELQRVTSLVDRLLPQAKR